MCILFSVYELDNILVRLLSIDALSYVDTQLHARKSIHIPTHSRNGQPENLPRDCMSFLDLDLPLKLNYLKSRL